MSIDALKKPFYAFWGCLQRLQSHIFLFGFYHSQDKYFNIVLNDSTWENVLHYIQSLPFPQIKKWLLIPKQFFGVTEEENNHLTERKGCGRGQKGQAGRVGEEQKEKDKRSRIQVVLECGQKH